MHAQKVVSLVEARAALSRLAQEVAQGGGAVAITQRSKVTAMLVNPERFEQDMAELALYRRQRQTRRKPALTGLMEITGDLAAASRRLADAHAAAIKHSGDTLRHALRD